MPAALSARIDAQLREHFAAFIERSCGASAPPASLAATDLRRFDEGTGKRLALETAQLLEPVTAMPDHPRIAALNTELGNAVEHADKRFVTEGFHQCVTRRLCVHEVDSRAWSAGAADLCYIKVNHAFWEQLYAVFASRPQPERMRIDHPERFRRLYVDSQFLLPLVDLMRRHVRQDGEQRRLDHLHFGISLYAGMKSHARILADFNTTDTDTRRIYSGAAIGLDAFFDVLYGDCRVHCSDGCFPKVGLENGQLRDCLQHVAGGAGAVVFVVPPHLRGIRLPLAKRARQDILFVSRGNVYATWLSALFSYVRHVLLRLAYTDHVVVITQSAVFSALLGLYLREAKQALHGSNRRLDFLDLGQVTDLAAPEAGGPWIKRFNVGEKALFTRQSPGWSPRTLFRRRSAR